MLRALDDAGQQVPRAPKPIVLDDRIQRLKPLTRLDRVDLH